MGGGSIDAGLVFAIIKEVGWGGWCSGAGGSAAPSASGDSNNAHHGEEGHEEVGTFAEGSSPGETSPPFQLSHPIPPPPVYSTKKII